MRFVFKFGSNRTISDVAPFMAYCQGVRDGAVSTVILQRLLFPHPYQRGASYQNWPSPAEIHCGVILLVIVEPFVIRYPITTTTIPVPRH